MGHRATFDPDDELSKRRAEKAEITPYEIMRTAWELWLEGGITFKQLAQTCGIVARIDERWTYGAVAMKGGRGGNVPRTGKTAPKRNNWSFTGRR